MKSVIISDSISLIIVTNRTSKSSLSPIVTEYRSEVAYAIAIDGASCSFRKGGQRELLL